jgi:hypothetical protein
VLDKPPWLLTSSRTITSKPTTGSASYCEAESREDRIFGGRARQAPAPSRGATRHHLRLARVADLDSAKQILRRFVADRSHRLTRDAQAAWRPAPKDLDRICCFIHERMVSTTLSCKGRDAASTSRPNRGAWSCAGSEVQLYQGLDGRVALYYGDTRIDSHYR